MALSVNLGFPRIGKNRELKKALESYWKGELDEAGLLQAGRAIRQANWQTQKAAGVDHIPSGDFSFYDQMLDTTAMLGAVPSRFGYGGGQVDLKTYFAMARGTQTVAPLAMTKWFDTNYHYMVPELEPGMVFKLSSTRVIDEFIEARDMGIVTRPALVGPVTWILLAQAKSPQLKPLALLDQIVPVYAEALSQLKANGAQWVQIDEPALALDLDAEQMAAFGRAYNKLCAVESGLKVSLTTCFDTVEDKLDLLNTLPVAAIHLDLVRAPQQLEKAVAVLGPGKKLLSLGLVNGRNIWKTDLDKALQQLQWAAGKLGNQRLMAGPSCSLLHSPVDVAGENELDNSIRERLAFAVQKLDEIVVLRRALDEGRTAVEKQFAANQAVFHRSAACTRVNNPQVRQRMEGLAPEMFSRKSPYSQRKIRQQQTIDLPPLPTTNIGSFPQTPDIRKARADYKKGLLNDVRYEQAMKHEIEKVIRFQERVNMDVLVHGEPERNDMVEYFGELLEGVAFTRNGWVQSYGSRCVKPPVIYGDVSRPNPMTVRWLRFAQALTDRPVKGMLTGPITILQWSFVREDQPRRDTAFQIALAIRDEVADLEAAGIQMIQIDEPAFREGVPLRHSRWDDYFDWAVRAFKLATCGVQDQTQIHTHMCYSDFNDIIKPIAALDADVISMEASRNDIRLLNAFVDYHYPNEIGPGVYDIHSPRVPSVEEMKIRIRKMIETLSVQQLWINPDCGLKTRAWPETEAALANMAQATKEIRQKLKSH